MSRFISFILLQRHIFFIFGVAILSTESRFHVYKKKEFKKETCISFLPYSTSVNSQRFLATCTSTHTDMCFQYGVAAANTNKWGLNFGT